MDLSTRATTNCQLRVRLSRQTRLNKPVNLALLTSVEYWVRQNVASSLPRRGQIDFFCRFCQPIGFRKRRRFNLAQQSHASRNHLLGEQHDKPQPSGDSDYDKVVNRAFMSPAPIQRMTVASLVWSKAAERFSLHPPHKPCLHLMIVEYIAISLSLKRGEIPPMWVGTAFPAIRRP